MLFLAIAVTLLASVAPISALKSEVQQLLTLITSIKARLDSVANAKLEAEKSTIFTCWQLQLSNFKKEAETAFAPLSAISTQADSILQSLNSMSQSDVEELAKSLYEIDGGILQQGYNLIGDYSKLAANIHIKVLNLKSTSCSD
ncbi:hypothetical protein GE061_003115 [Apolygus lucorum]|uniref:Uncharacterized protein n=1 Tax=Apolygus lucorum TaxID=248454 RepID=A0A6A4JQ55_APOLU|nr:hypothetical protein GE061_003115 [Apolygus lucorum]